MSHVTLQQADLMLKSIKGAITNGINNSVADWNQNDSGAQNYIKNRPFYESTVLSTIFDETFINTFSSGFTSNITINEGETYTVILNGTEYSCQSFVDTSSNEPIIGFSQTDMMNIEIDAPFSIKQSRFSIRSSEATEADGIYSCTLKLLDSAGVEIIAESTFTFEPSEEMMSPTLLNITVGKEYQVTVSGQTYNCTAFSFNGLNVLGNEAFFGGTDNGLPFVIVDYMSMATMVILQEFDQLSTHNIKIEGNVVDIHTIDEKFLPQISWNNLSDRPFYKEEGAKEFFDVNTFIIENDLEWEYFDGIFMIQANVPCDDSEQLIIGEKYACIINGTKYISTAVSIEPQPGLIFPAIGDAEAFINEDFDNFTYMFIASSFGVISAYKGEMPPIEFRILKDDLKKLDPEFLPESGIAWSAIDNKPVYQGKKALFTKTCQIGRPNFYPNEVYDFVNGKTYQVIVDGVEYESTCMLIEGLAPGFVIANVSFELLVILAPAGLIEDYPGLLIQYYSSSEANVTVSVMDKQEKIKPEVLPDGGVGYEETIFSEELLFEGSVTTDKVFVEGFAYGHSYEIESLFAFEVNQNYTVTVDGISYDCVSFSINGAIAVGSTPEELISLETVTYPFTFGGLEGKLELLFRTEGEHTVKIEGQAQTIVIHKIDPKFLPDDGFGYEEIISLGGLLFEDSVTANMVVEENFVYGYITESPFTFEVNQSYTVTIDGISYDCVSFSYGGAIAVGSTFEELGTLETVTYPFTFAVFERDLILYFRTEGEHTVKIEKQAQTIIHKIDEKFLPENIGGATSWDELTDKPFYEEEVEIEIEYTNEIFNETISTDYQSNDYPTYVYEVTDSIPFTLVAGNTYNVTIDAIDYKGLVAAELNNGTICIGSDDVPFVENPQYPFFISQTEGRTTFGFRTEGPHNVIIELVREPETIYDDVITTNTSNSEGTYPVYYVTLSDLPFELEVGKFYDVVIDEITYNNLECFSSDSFSAIGTDMVDMATLENPPYPFFIGSETTHNTVFFASRTEGEHNVKITESNKRSAIAIHHIEAKFIPPLSSMTFIDAKTGYEYIGYVYDGNFITFRKYEKIELTKMPDKLRYATDEKFDPTGMIITGIYSDGTRKEITDFDYEEFVSKKTIMIYCVDGMGQIQIDLELDSAVLLDFVFTRNADGICTLTGWKGTLNGEPSTEMIIPDRDFIVL